MKRIVLILIIGFSALLNCSNSENITTENEVIDNEVIDNEVVEESRTVKILSLGDSYTIGTSVCETCSYPNQLKDSVVSYLNPIDDISINIIAAAGWTTTSLISAVNNAQVDSNYDLATLLIGVNNQFQGLSFQLYEDEFEELINIAITAAKGIKSNIIVLSIPDYAYTPFGQNFGNPNETSEEIDHYNAFAKAYCLQNGILYIDITDISREGLENPEIIASDGLHLSEIAYSLFVERILPIALEKL